jgi:hypothetical protein
MAERGIERPSANATCAGAASAAGPRCVADWDPRNGSLWRTQPIRAEHVLHHSPLFGADCLADLIERYPRDFYSIIHMGPQGAEPRFWREGDLTGLSGHEVLDAIAKGRFWLNLRLTNRVDKRYGAVLGQLFAELGERLPELRARTYDCGILISSPRAQVYYHADLPGQLLLQIAGRKRVFLYPPVPPFLNPEHLEHIAIFGVEVDIPYAGWFDEFARVHDLGPGQLVHWPHNAPHRVENADSLNVSMTVEYWTDEIRRKGIVTRANGILRYRFGRVPASAGTSGLSFWGKAILQRGFRKSAWMKKQKAGRRPIEFRLDRADPGAIVETAKRS